MIEPGLAKTWPLSTPSLSTPLNKAPILSPASPLSNNLRNISTPVQVVLEVSFIPIISISSPTLITPLSTRPVTTVPRPEIENTSSIGIRKGRSTGRSGLGIYASTCFISSTMAGTPISPVSPSKAFKADPLTIGISSPGNSYCVSSSLISNSTNSINSGSST